MGCQNVDVSATFDVRTGASAPAASRRGWWVLPEVVAFAVLAVLAVPYLGARSGQSGIHAQAAERGSRILEQATPAEHHNHGHEVTTGDRIFCGIDVFGVDPPTAIVIDDVTTVYGYYFCAVGRPGLEYMQSSRSDGPIVVNLVGTPSVTIAASGQGYQDRVRAMMPDQYEQYCFNGLPDGTVAAEVRGRYEAEL